jgi:HAD superfamily hydrolase (TIGR01509 family)
LTPPPSLVIFDCDGVLVDSEPVSNRVVAQELTRLGWTMTSAEADTRFLGMTFPDMVPLIETQLGRKLPHSWRADLLRELMDRMAEEVEAVPGAIEALSAVTAIGLPWRIASNSSHIEMAVKFRRIGIADLALGRTHSFEDVARGKPAPDLFLAAAAAEGIPPAASLVIEDSVTGARAAAAAGMACLGYAPHGDNAALRETGAILFDSMHRLPGLIAAAIAGPPTRPR